MDKIKNKFGYIRVSSKSQETNSSLESQKQELLQRGIEEVNIRIEVGSATSPLQDRPVLHRLITEELQTNDLLMVTKIDRCARNTLEFLKLQENLYQRSITFVALDIPHSEDLAVNKFIATTLSALATFETERRKERQRQGIEAAKKLGRYKGRKSVITKKLVQQVSDLLEKKQLSVTDIAKVTGISRGTIYKLLKEELGYVSNRLVRFIKPTENND
jgi:DNA invertase Pin-like site-specific DNA recombinase